MISHRRQVITARRPRIRATAEAYAPVASALAGSQFQAGRGVLAESVTAYNQGWVQWYTSGQSLASLSSRITDRC